MVNVHEFEGQFLGYFANIIVTSVAGHIFNRDFPEKYSNWNAFQPVTLFDADTVKKEANPKVEIIIINNRNLNSVDNLKYILSFLNVCLFRAI